MTYNRETLTRHRAGSIPASATWLFTLFYHASFFPWKRTILTLYHEVRKLINHLLKISIIFFLKPIDPNRYFLYYIYCQVERYKVWNLMKLVLDNWIYKMYNISNLRGLSALAPRLALRAGTQNPLAVITPHVGSNPTWRTRLSELLSQGTVEVWWNWQTR